ncbi:hypothetical protein EW146_g8268 [Bondarzewia mesenterica]|uniref:Uncharacterized protein n=1 Tax=Bondarzewia mesenterica TaxID=1095465 RepID=A0A4S4LGB1_9AGAM|nr:hypothetical protein EW146_g8268 [Bondarzewia mesenterica]
MTRQSHSTPPEGTTFKDLCMSQADYAIANSPLASPSPARGENLSMLKIVARSDDVKKVFKEVNGSNGQDWIELSFNRHDSVLSIMRNLEQIIKVPMAYWALVCGSVFYSLTQIVMGLEHFRKTEAIKFTLLLLWDVEESTFANLKTHTWMHAPPSNLLAKLPSDPREQAERWNQDMVDVEKGDEMDAYISILRDAVKDAVSEETELHEREWEKIADGASVLSSSVEDDGDYPIRDADVMARMHSVNSPQSVDVHFFYHHRTCWSPVELWYCLGYRINSIPVECEPSIGESRHVRRAHQTDGWRPMGWFFLDDRRAEHSACPITRTDLQHIHDSLFGPAEAGKLGKRVSLRTTARLLLASVGITFEIALNQEHAKNRTDGYLERYGDPLIYVCLEEVKDEKPGISPAHLRKICGIDPLADDDMSDLMKEQRTAPVDESDEDLDSDDDEYVRVIRLT